jgi:hypothetical protein
MTHGSFPQYAVKLPSTGSKAPVMDFCVVAADKNG